MDAGAVLEWLDHQAAATAFSGVVLVTRDGLPVLSHAAGVAHRGHGVPVTTTTRFRVASIAKMPVAVAALRLVERGLLALDQSLIEVLPPEWVPASMTPRHTLHHLLSHTSGIPNYHDVDDPGFDSFEACWARLPPQTVRRPADLLPLVADQPLRFPAGERFEYADVNYVLVGMVVESVTGEPFADVVRREVLEPAGMLDAGFDANDDDPARLAVGYVSSDEPFASWRSNIFSLPAAGLPDGGLVATADDLDRFLRALCSGVLLQEETMVAMATPQGPPSDDLEQYGYGLELVVESGEVTIVGHGGSDPGISALVSHWPSEDTTVIVLCNHDRGSWAVTQRLAATMGLHDPRE